MATHRHPVVVRDPAGSDTAIAVDEEGLAGFGIRQLWKPAVTEVFR